MIAAIAEVFTKKNAGNSANTPKLLADDGLKEVRLSKFMGLSCFVFSSPEETGKP
jgi:hypothetical protein